MQRFKKFCTGSFRTKTVIEKNDDYRVIKINNMEIRLMRSMSLTKSERNRRINSMPPHISGPIDPQLPPQFRVSIINQNLFKQKQKKQPNKKT